MKKCLITVFLLIITFANGYSQQNNDFNAFAKSEKLAMLKAYGRKDIPDYKKHLSEFLSRYNKLSDKEKKSTFYGPDGLYLLLADLYAMKGDKNNAWDYVVKSNPTDYDDLADDHDLDMLKKDPRYVKLLTTLKDKKSEMQLTLQHAPKYNPASDDKFPEFTYQSADDASLISLKTAYNLDSVAGKGNDVSKIINLMEWVHYLVPHDGSKGNPVVKNALSMLQECSKNKKTLNCRGLAIILNEVYLAEGFRSRYVTCLPKDTADNDCHVITMVWSTSLRKWLWMDPTFMAYVMDENGMLLSIEEVRQRLISDKPLILNPDANRNHAASQTKSDYLGWYMSKNLYKLECPASSTYDYETQAIGKKIAFTELVPGSTHPQTQTWPNGHGGSQTTYFTNNAAAFWAAPPAGTEAKAASAKTPADYEQVMQQFKTYYNSQQTDSIVNLFGNPKEMKSWFTAGRMTDLTTQYGSLISYTYAGQEEGNEDVALFKMVFDKSVHIMGISINDANKMETFRFETSSHYIDKVLAKTL